MKKHDLLYRYVFENSDVRGEIVTLSETYQHILHHHDYPLVVQRILGELLVATSLLTALLKFEGDITLQLQGDGALSLVVINGNDEQEMRGVARYSGDISETATLTELLGKGYVVITIKPKYGESYQGIIEINDDSLVSSLEAYFTRSEQLDTRLFLQVGQYNGQPVAAGMLLQVLPGKDREKQQLDFEHLSTLTSTITADELFSLPTRDILHRLYHQEDVRLFEAQGVSFKCFCSEDRCGNALMTLSDDEIEEMLGQDKKVDMYCDYCGTHYIFDRVDIERLRKGGQPAPTTIH